MEEQDFPNVGEFLIGEFVGKLDDTTYKVKLPEEYDKYKNWKAIYSRQGDENCRIGETSTFLIFNVSLGEKTIHLTHVEFGRFSVEAQFLTELMSSVRTLQTILDNPDDITIGVSPHKQFSAFKTCCQGIIKKNRIDWMNLLDIMNNPTPDFLKEIYPLVSGLETKLYKYSKHLTMYDSPKKQELLASKKQKIDWSIKMLRRDDFMAWLSVIESNVVKASLKLQATKLTSRAYKKLKKLDSHKEDRDSLEKINLPHETIVKHKKANTTHKKVLTLLVGLLEKSGYIVEFGTYVDAFTRLVSGPAIFEVKSITERNEMSQCRKGLSQLYEYRYRHEIANASLWLVLSSPLHESWIVDYLLKDRAIEVIWLDEKEFSGPSITKLLQK